MSGNNVSNKLAKSTEPLFWGIIIKMKCCLLLMKKNNNMHIFINSKCSVFF